MQSIRHARGLVKAFSPFWKGDGHVTDDTLMTRVLVAAYDHKRDHLWCFSGEFDGQSVELDRAEIAEARWFPLERLPGDTARYVGRILALYS